MSSFTKNEKVGFYYEKGEGTIIQVLGGDYYLVNHPSGMDLKFHKTELVKLARTQVEFKSRNDTKPIPENQFSFSFKLKEGLNWYLTLNNGYGFDYFVILYTLFNGKSEILYKGIIKSHENSLIDIHDLSKVKKIKLKALNLDENAHLDELLIFTKNVSVKDIIESNSSNKEEVYSFFSDQLPTSPKKVVEKVNTKNIAKTLLNPVNNIAEVDLHIDELIDDTIQMNKHEILKYQLDYLQKCINECFERKIRKLTVIHGIGKGILKHEVEKTAKEFANISIQPSPMSRYGIGATDLLFRHN